MPDSKLPFHEKLKDGFLDLTRVTRNGGSFLDFYVEINTRHPADTIWEQLVLGQTDSDKSWLWPVEFERCAEPVVGGLHPGCTSRMTYHVPRFDKPGVPAKAVTYTYKWPQYDPDKRLLEYRTLDHPLEGGAVVQVLPLKGGRSQLRWKGSYKEKEGASQEIVINSIINYFPLLFHTFEDHMEAGPERFESVTE